jgi:hypothetical protein
MTTPDLAPPVAAAIDEIRADWPGANLTVRPDGEGGAYVIVEPLTLKSPPYQTETWIGFRITFQYPYADVYPHFVRHDLRLDGGTRPAMQAGAFMDRTAIQISRRSNKLDPRFDTAAGKIRKILHWLNDQT